MERSLVSVSPVRDPEPPDNLVLLPEIYLDLLPEVEDRTVSAGTQHLLVQTPLQAMKPD